MLNAATRLLVNKGGLFAFLVFTELLDNQCHQIIKNDFEGVAIEYKQVSNVPLLFKRTHPLSRPALCSECSIKHSFLDTRENQMDMELYEWITGVLPCLALSPSVVNYMCFFPHMSYL